MDCLYKSSHDGIIKHVYFFAFDLMEATQAEIPAFECSANGSIRESPEVDPERLLSKVLAGFPEATLRTMSAHCRPIKILASVFSG